MRLAGFPQLRNASVPLAVMVGILPTIAAAGGRRACRRDGGVTGKGP